MDIENIYKKYFTFLEKECGFRKKRVIKEENYQCIIMKNEFFGIRLSWEPREGGINIYICKLTKAKKMPKYNIFIKKNTKINGFYIEDIMLLMDPKVFKIIESKKYKLLQKDIKDIKDIILIYSKFLKNNCQKILSIENNIFNKVSKIIKKRKED